MVLSTQNKTTTSNKCIKCNLDHPLHRCPEFLKSSPNNRLQFAKNKQLCLNCLMKTHKTDFCTSIMSCRHCQKRHHTLLHINLSTFNIQTESAASKPIIENNSDSSPSINTEEIPPRNFFSSNTKQALLATALVNVHSPAGRTEELRALIDSGSQVSFITAAAARRLKIPLIKTKQVISGLGQNSSTVSNHKTTVHLESANSTFNTKIQALVIKSITDRLPAEKISTAGFDHLANIRLADPQFFQPGKVDLLLGAEVYAQIIQKGIIKSSVENQPVALNTSLGWIVMGPGNKSSKSNQTFSTTTTFKTTKKGKGKTQKPSTVPPTQSSTINMPEPIQKMLKDLPIPWQKIEAMRRTYRYKLSNTTTIRFTRDRHNNVWARITTPTTLNNVKQCNQNNNINQHQTTQATLNKIKQHNKIINMKQRRTTHTTQTTQASLNNIQKRKQNFNIKRHQATQITQATLNHIKQRNQDNATLNNTSKVSSTKQHKQNINIKQHQNNTNTISMLNDIKQSNKKTKLDNIKTQTMRGTLNKTKQHENKQHPKQHRTTINTSTNQHTNINLK